MFFIKLESAGCKMLPSHLLEPQHGSSALTSPTMITLLEKMHSQEDITRLKCVQIRLGGQGANFVKYGDHQRDGISSQNRPPQRLPMTEDA